MRSFGKARATSTKLQRLRRNISFFRGTKYGKKGWCFVCLLADTWESPPFTNHYNNCPTYSEWDVTWLCIAGTSCLNNPLKMIKLFSRKHIVQVGYSITSSTAQGAGGSFKNRKPIGEVGCCESRMAERIHWWTDRGLELCFLEWLQWLQWSPHHNCWM